MSTLTQNEYGFDLEKDNPFVIFRHLNQIATEKVGVENVLDLSRGDPGYGFAPNVRSRKFFSFLISLDTIFNNFEVHFKDFTAEKEAELLAEVEKHAHATYKPAIATELMNDFAQFCSAVIEAAERQDLKWTHFDVLFHVFKYATVSGGCYHDPYGELISRVVLADYQSEQLGVKIGHDDLVCTGGASGAIGTFFKAFGKEGGGLLKKGETVLITSPVYFPYLNMLEDRGVTVETISVDPESGQFDEETFEKLGKIEPKIIFLVDPDNPLGLAKNEKSLKLLAKYAEKVDAVIVSDEVYSSFIPGKKSILEFARNRTIRIDARSKIERSTGLRFGEFVIVPEANEFITEKWREHIPEGIDLKTYLHDAKAPGGVNGAFRHVTFVPGPAQILALCHIILGGEEREKYRELVEQNMQSWYDELGVDRHENFYYSLINFNSIGTEAKKVVPAEQKFLDLAERGVVLIPANLFFSASDREKKDRTNFARASLPNLTNEQVVQAAKIIREYLVD